MRRRIRDVGMPVSHDINEADLLTYFGHIGVACVEYFIKIASQNNGFVVCFHGFEILNEVFVELAARICLCIRILPVGWSKPEQAFLLMESSNAVAVSGSRADLVSRYEVQRFTVPTSKREVSPPS